MSLCPYNPILLVTTQIAVKKICPKGRQPLDTSALPNL